MSDLTETADPRTARLRQALAAAFALMIFTAVLWVLHRELGTMRLHDVRQHLALIPRARVCMCLLLTILGYLVLTGYDGLGIRYLGRKLGAGRIMVTSFLSYVFSNNVGLSVLGATAVRLRLYTAWGLSPTEVVKLVAIVSLTFWAGILALAGWMLLICPPALLVGWGHLIPLRLIGVLLLGVVTLYLLACACRRRPLRFGQWEFSLPSIKLALAQVAIGSTDWTLAAAALYVLLPKGVVPFPAFLAAYLLAQVVGLSSHVPGGVAIFETGIILLLKPYVPAAAILGPLLVYRIVYYLIPLAAGILLTGGHEMRAHKRFVSRVATAWDEALGTLVPHALALTTFLAGALLLLSGATPGVAERLRWLGYILPVPAVEISHFLGSLAGVGLLFLARGLQRRLDGAYWLALTLLTAGIVFSLLKGLDYEEATLLAIMLLCLLPCRSQFRRHSSLLAERFTPAWIAAIAIVLLGSLWLGVFCHKRLEYTHELWWRFGLFADAPRFLRAAVGTVIVAVIISLARLLRAVTVKTGETGVDDLPAVAHIVQQSPKASANLALLGDKRFLLNDEKTGFVMYGIQGRCWVAMGDPVGPRDQRRELAWQFREMADQHGAYPVFYEVDAEDLSVYVDLGLTLLKIGETARVPLGAFSVAGRAGSGLRHEVSRAERAGCRFEIIPAHDTPDYLAALREISDRWLTEKSGSEKRFSLGFFDERYVSRFPVALVRQGETIVAFATLWSGAPGTELSIDLMRYSAAAPSGAMSYLLTQLLLWGQREGFLWFDLGMAPLSGLAEGPLSSFWQRAGAKVYRYGEHFYGFGGVRRFKQKFNPVWTPKYLASPGGLALPRIIADLVMLISGPRRRGDENTAP